MATLTYLWNNRARYPFSSVLFYRAWAKRILCLPELIKRNQRRSGLVRKGASIHPTAEIGETVVDGHKSKLSIGAFSFVGKVRIALHEKVIIGDKVCINDGVQILTASHDISDPDWSSIKAQIIIEDYAWIATNAILLPGVTIGKGAVVGAGAVVSKSIAPGEIVVGNPAKSIQKKRTEDLRYNPCEFLAGNRAWLIG
ncbi:acyltransferase [Paludibacter jiangxiensis]|uniref:Maltose O-acetyltransferase n=1 Tax=Paludibacter jiangxiensis TaxID=681398 RepID=A0A171A3F6_9BACT|nr:acetyltransferase [Paludibacter jiangxiensis]GAT63252.1 maltose O-acetyltransferase [Paludibacter jiangxiensis]